MLTYHFPNDLKEAMYIYLYRCIKEDILEHKLKANEKLPSKRTLAEHLQISIITVQNAYNQLLIEGFIYSIEKKGYFVSEINELPKLMKQEEMGKRVVEKYPLDLLRNSVDIQTFPFDAYSKINRRVLTERRDILLEKTPPQGVLELREAIAKHLSQFSGLLVSSDQIIIGAGSEYLYNQIIQLLGREVVYGLENPGHLAIEKVYSLNGVDYTFIDLDEAGISVKKLKESNASVIHTSVAHHFPTGITMPVKRRMELLRWANDNNGIIIEDDYDSEFRLKGKPISPLFALDNNDCVIYMNTFTKTLSPSLRIAYMVLPKKLLKIYQQKLSFYSNSVSAFEQVILAEFINEGYFERHIHRMRNSYKQIRDELINALSKRAFYQDIRIKEANAGLHFLIEYDFDISDTKVVELAHSLQFNIGPLSNYYHQKVDTHTLIINYSGLALKDVELAVNKLENLFQLMSNMV